MKILAVIEELRYQNASGGIVNYNLLKALSKSNHTIDVITLESVPAIFKTEWTFGTVTTLPHDPKKAKDKLLLLIPKLRASYAYITGLPITHYRRKQNWKKEIKKHLANTQYDCIIAMGGGDAFNTHHALTELSIPKATKVIGLIHDPYPHSHYPEPYKADRHYVSDLLVKRFQAFVNKTNYLVFPSLRLQQWMEQFYTGMPAKAKIIPHVSGYKNFVNPADIDKNAINIDFAKLTLMHSGSLLSGREPKPLIEAAKILMQKFPEAKNDLQLIFLGSAGHEHDKIIEQYKNNVNILFHTNRVNYSTSFYLQTKVFANIIIEGNYKDSPFLPAKFTDYVDAGKQIMALSPQNSEVARLLGSNYHYLAQNGETDKIVLILEQLYLLWKQNPMATFTRTDLQQYVSAENVLKLYEDFLKP